MASSYTTNFSIEKMGTGDQSGTWGTTTNHNFDILDRIASYKSVAITTNADTHTLTVREASPGSGTENLQDGMYRVIKFTGALDSNCTVTISPNSAAAFFIFINATTDSGSSGPYSLIFTQGSGANVTVTNGKSAVIYADGAGSGAAVVNSLDKPLFGTITATADTAAGDTASIGYTASEGLILTGQGSTNDVTIKNDADADVIEIPTGTQNVTFAGDITLAGDITTASNADVDINPNGTGNVVLKTDLVSVGGGSEVGHVSSNGAFDMKISSNSGTNSGTIVITDAANGAITLAPNGTGIVDVQGSMNSSISTTGKSIVFGF